MKLDIENVSFYVTSFKNPEMLLDWLETWHNAVKDIVTP